MADTKVTALTAETVLAANDVLPVVDVSDTTMAATGTTKKVAISDLMTQAPVQSVAGKTGAVTLVPSDAGAAAASHSHAESDVTSLTTDLATKITKPTDAAGWLHDNGAGVLAWTTPTTTDVGAQPSNTTLTSLAGLTNAAGKLTNDGAGGLSWAAGGGGGQTLYDVIVAPSGGDYTTLQAALAAGSNGQTIFVRAGTYTEADYTPATNLQNITIVGENPLTTTCTISGSWLLDGSGWRIFNLGFSGGDIYVTSGRIRFQGCHFTITGAHTIQWNSTAPKGSAFINCTVDGSGWSAGNGNNGLAFGPGMDISGSYFLVNAFTGSNGTFPILLQGANFTGNTVEVYSASTNYWVLGSYGPADVISGNTFIGATAGERLVSLSGTRASFTGNILRTAGLGVYSAGAEENTITGNTFESMTAYGVQTSSAPLTIVSNNFFYSCATGIYFSSSDDCVASSNITKFGTTAIQLTSSSHCVITGNRTGGGPTTGITITNVGSTSNLVVGNNTNGATTGFNDSGTTTTAANNI